MIVLRLPPAKCDCMKMPPDPRHGGPVITHDRVGTHLVRWRCTIDLHVQPKPGVASPDGG